MEGVNHEYKSLQVNISAGSQQTAKHSSTTYDSILWRTNPYVKSQQSRIINDSGEKTQISHPLIRCVSIVHDKTMKAECEKSLEGGGGPSTLWDPRCWCNGCCKLSGSEAVWFAAKLTQFVPLCSAVLHTLPSARREDMLSRSWKSLNTPLVTNSHYLSKCNNSSALLQTWSLVVTL
jgi:hypothetical protein